MKNDGRVSLLVDLYLAANLSPFGVPTAAFSTLNKTSLLSNLVNNFVLPGLIDLL
jgi:hypothetical protein